MKKPPSDVVVQAPTNWFDAVVRSLRKANRRMEGVSIDENSSIVDDLGFDSLKMVELLFVLEEELGVTDFPLQPWWDSELARTDSARFTVGSLLAQVELRMSGAARHGDGT